MLTAIVNHERSSLSRPAMMVYAHVLNELVKKDQGFDNGTLVTQLMWNRTFQGKRANTFHRLFILEQRFKSFAGRPPENVKECKRQPNEMANHKIS